MTEPRDGAGPDGPHGSDGTPEGAAATAAGPRRKRPRAARILEGIGAAPGVAIGRALVLDRGSTQVFCTWLDPEDVAAEVERLEAAVAQARRQLLDIKDKLRVASGDEYAFIFDAHMLFLADKKLVGEALRMIRDDRVNAEWAVDQAARRIEHFFQQIDDPYLRERAQDVADVTDRILRNLAGSEHHDLSELTEDVIIVAHALPPSEAASLQHPHVVGFVTEVGGRTSHTAIVAKSLEIPAIVGVKDALVNIPQGSLVAVDGRLGRVVVTPNEAALQRYVRRRRVYQSREQRLISNRDLPAVTTDAVPLTLRANIELLEELESLHDHGAHGIGLYRSEFLYLKLSPQLPTEEQHYQTYRKLIEDCAPHSVTIRTLDLGGEKYFHDVLGPGEANPILGLRAIRFALTRPDIIEAQLRGILRAAVHGPTKVMFPLISCMEELETIHELLDRMRSELRAEGGEFRDDVPLGIMVEVPSAAIVADLMARKVDFFAIGTNDLIQYTLAVDRGNEHVSHLFQPLHPAVLRLLDRTAKAAQDADIGLSICGEMAASPLHAPLLLGLGIEEMSMDPVSIPVVKEVLRAVSASQMRELAREVLKLESSQQVERRLMEALGPVFESVGVDVDGPDGARERGRVTRQAQKGLQ